MAADGAPEYIRRAAELLALSNLSRKEREAVSLMEKAVADYEAELECADYEGYQRGDNEQKLKIAKNLLIGKIPLNVIQMATKLDMKTIEDLQAQVNSWCALAPAQALCAKALPHGGAF
jgi:predicted transposase/invertase (TIGR01784 family)